ncbi:hypothetical protein ACR777_10865 [Sphingobacterium spiritivorum]|uniref:hypothetical protein n=1 Tax=Sphingobacterium spiritivorum TaxID=258 RepID=UPI003DA6551D
MKKMNFKSGILAALTVLLSISLLYSCDKDDDNVSRYPKNVKIAYSITSKSKDIKTGKLTFTDSTGKDSVQTNGQVPFNKSVPRLISKQGEKAKLAFASAGNGEITLEIKVDDQVVKTESFKSAADSLKGSIEYIF